MRVAAAVTALSVSSMTSIHLLLGEIFSAPTRDEKLKPRNKSGSVKAVH
jgi:hypothetical protein